MDNNINEEQWYRTADDDRADAAIKQKKSDKKKKTRRIAGIVLLAVVLIAGTSVAFSGIGSSGSLWVSKGSIGPFSWQFGEDFDPEDFSDDFFGNREYDIPYDNSEGEAEMPDSAEDFFDSFYQEVEDGSANAQNNIPTVKYEGKFEIELEKKGEEISLGDLYENCSDSIVAIYGYEDGYPGYYWGTGVVLSRDGLILTNSHVIEGCDSVRVKLNDNRELDASLVGADGISDLAVLKVESDDLVPAHFGDSNALRVGDAVAAIGNPLGEEFRLTLTNGIISAIDRGVSYKGRSMSLLQTNTAINSGNSGGALFNMCGQVIGITNMKMMSSYSSIEGIGFAIPSATVKSVVSALIKDGRVMGRPSIGITVGAVPEQAKEKYDYPDGLYVSEVQENSDAAKKGIKKGDVILEANHVPLKTVDELKDMKDAMNVNDPILLKVWRDGETFEVEVLIMETNDVY